MTNGARSWGALLVLAMVPVACATEGVSSTSNLANATLDVPGDDGAEGSREPSRADEPSAPPPYRACPSDRWCSELYAPTWTPDQPATSDGRFLHDFSYAGYRYGARPPADPPGAVHDVVKTYKADPTGKADASSAIQGAIAAASKAGGGIVYFPPGTYRIDQRLTVEASGVVLRGAGTSSVLRFPRKSGVAHSAHITFSGLVTRDSVRTLAADAPARAERVLLHGTDGLDVGDDVSVGFVITPEFIAEHGMEGTWKTFAGKYQTIFRRKVVAIDRTKSPHEVTLDVPLRYPVKIRDGAGLQKETGYLREVGIEHLSVSDAVAWSDAWAEDRVHVITMNDVADAWILDVHSVPAPGATGQSASDETPYHLRSNGILVEDAKRVSILESSLENPQNRGSGGNGYLFEVSRTSEVLVADTVARRGRHNFIQNWGFGNSGTVFLRCTSSGSELLSLIGGKLTPEKGASEHHHSLAMATLVDSCQLDDGFKFENRGAYSDGAGHTGTGSVVWRASGTGTITSKQYGWGYVIGTEPSVQVDTEVDAKTGAGTAPEDFVEGRDEGAKLFPPSLYEDQRARRLEQP